MWIAVLGAHRSGTSALAGILQSLGLHFGDPAKALPVTDHNRKGYWERQDVMDINDEMLRGMGCEWDQVAGFDPEQLMGIDASPWAGRIAGILRGFGGQTSGFLKDPRLCLTLPVWERVERPAMIVLVVRHPLEVARSLAARKDCSLMAGLALWEVYNRMARRWIGDRPCLRISFNRFRREPWEETNRLAGVMGNLGIRLPRAPDQARIQDWFDRDLVNNEVTPQEESMLPPTILELYQHLLDPSSASLSSETLSLFARENLAYHQHYVRRLEQENRQKLVELMLDRDRFQRVETAVQALEQSRSWQTLRRLQRFWCGLTGKGHLPSPMDKIKVILSEVKDPRVS